MVSVSNGDSATVQGTSTASHFDYSDSTFVAYLGENPNYQLSLHALRKHLDNTLQMCL